MSDITELDKKNLEKLYIDFDTAFGKGSAYFKYVKKLRGTQKEFYAFLKKLYEKNSFKNVKYSPELKIPKIIHQLWIGPYSIPQEFQNYQKKLKNLHPDWEYRLWTEEEFKKYPLLEPFQTLFEKAATFGEKSDIVRFGVLYQYGGVYVDMDVECFKPLDILNHCYDFYASMFPPTQQLDQSKYGLLMKVPHNGGVLVQTAIIGAKPSHPLFKEIGKTIQKRWEIDPKSNVRNDKVTLTFYRTFLAFGDTIFNYLPLDNSINIILPPCYFYHKIRGISIIASVDILPLIFYSIIRKKSPYAVSEKTFLIHHENMSWINAENIDSITFRSFVWLLFSWDQWKLFLKHKCQKWFFLKKKQKK